MSVTSQQAIGTLNTLIATCKDGEEGYRTAAQAVGRHEALRHLLESCTRQRNELLCELMGEAHRLGVAADGKATTVAVFHRWWMGLKAALALGDPAAVIAECERGERAALAHYEEALAQPLPPESHALLRRQYARLEEAHQRMQDMMAIATLNDLIAVSKDGEQGYAAAADSATDEDLKDFFHGCAGQRTQLAAELETVVERLGDRGRSRGTFAGLLHRGWMRAKGAFHHGNADDLLAECERGESTALRHYEAALKKALPADIRTLIETHAAKLRERARQLLALARATKGWEPFRVPEQP